MLLAVAATLQDDFADGVCFVPLASLRDVGLVPGAIATALGLTLSPARSALDLLREHLRDRALLLLLDNLAQLTAAAPALSDLLAVAPGVKALATSRTSLHLYGEKELAVPPLKLPDLQALPPLAELQRLEAIVLFVERAQAASADFALSAANAATVAAICARLDGLPLAIELAAAKVKPLGVGDLLIRLEHRLALLTGGPRDLPPRQQARHTAIQASYDLLGAPGQQLFRRLSVFVGPFALDADATVAGGQPGELLALVDSSMLQRWRGAGADAEVGSETRLSMLATLREFGQNELVEHGELESMRRAYAGYFLAWPSRPGRSYGDRRRRPGSGACARSRTISARRSPGRWSGVSARSPCAWPAPWGCSGTNPARPARGGAGSWRPWRAVRTCPRRCAGGPCTRRDRWRPI